MQHASENKLRQKHVAVNSMVKSLEFFAGDGFNIEG